MNLQQMEQMYNVSTIPPPFQNPQSYQRLVYKKHGQSISQVQNELVSNILQHKFSRQPSGNHF